MLTSRAPRSSFHGAKSKGARHRKRSMRCDIHPHAPAPTSYTIVLLYPCVIQMCSTSCLGHGYGYECHSPVNPQAKSRWLQMSGRLPRDLETSPLEIQNLLESSPRKSRFLVRGLAVYEGASYLPWHGERPYWRLFKPNHVFWFLHCLPRVAPAVSTSGTQHPGSWAT